MDGTLENFKTKNVSTCSIGSVTTTPKNSLVASDGGLPVTGALEASAASGSGFRAMGKIGLVGGLFHQLYKAPPMTNRATPTSTVEAAVI